MSSRVPFCLCTGELYQYQVPGFFLLVHLSLVFCLWPNSICLAYGKNTVLKYDEFCLIISTIINKPCSVG